jgi:tight adherence protein C
VLIMLLIGLVLVACATGLCVRAAGINRAQVRKTLASVDWYGFRADTSAGASASDGAKSGSLLPRLDVLATNIGGLAAGKLASLREDEVRKQLRAAGMYGLTARRFIGYRVLTGIGLPLFWLWHVGTAGSSPFRAIIGLIFAIAIGWRGPVMYVGRRARMRLDEIDYQMPELIDLLVTTVEAGVGFSGSLQMAAQRFQGALGAELRLALAEQGMGLSTEDALGNMLERAETPAMRSFVRAVLQGEMLGVSIGKILRDLAEDMRKRRRQKAEERAQKAPTKMLFPLIFLILPAMFVVLLGPAVIQMIRSLGGG